MLYNISLSDYPFIREESVDEFNGMKYNKDLETTYDIISRWEESIDTPVMVSNTTRDWTLRYYAGNNRTFYAGCKSVNGGDSVEWRYIIPFDKFDPINIDESLKYDIVE